MGTTPHLLISLVLTNNSHDCSFVLETEVTQVVCNFSIPFLLKIETIAVQTQFPGNSFTLPKFKNNGTAI